MVTVLGNPKSTKCTGQPCHLQATNASRATSGNLHVPLTHGERRKPLSFLCTDTDASASLWGVNPRRRWDTQVAAREMGWQQEP